MIEAEAIPYEPARLRGERLLVLAPHPDDEVIGCGGLVAQHLAEGRAVRILVATDGAQGGEAPTREEESRRGVARLGDGASIDFLSFRDRGLGDEAAEPLREALLSYRPDLVLVPSAIEIHPDHHALARVFCDLVQRDETLFADLATARVAFYEVGQPIRPNAIVDITDVAEQKYAAIAEHVSQLAQRDYVSYARGLNAYRAMTMPASSKYAEGYYVVDLPALRTMPFSELRRRTGAPPDAMTVHEHLPISVIVRTKDRPELLHEALQSIRASAYPCEIVVVNDGGARPEGLDDAKLVHHETSRGRAEAANAGVRAASNPFVSFLDDDDLYYSEHLTTLSNAARSTSHEAWYTDAVSAVLTIGDDGSYKAGPRLRLFEQDFDREQLLVDNYIPLPTLLLRRDSVLEAGGFDPQFDLFEDWDLLIRLAARGDFLRVPRVTCEIRHFVGGTSAVLAAPEGSDAFRAAKLKIWAKHGVGPAVFARVYERQKQRTRSFYTDATTIRGEANALRGDVARLQREKSETLARNAAAQDLINGYMMRQRELEASVKAMEDSVAEYHKQTARVEELVVELERQTSALEATRDALAVARQEATEAENAFRADLDRHRTEINRLQGLLEMIYHSRTWKLHTTLERIRGRG